VILVVTYLSILRTAASKSATLSFAIRFFSPLFEPQSLKSIIGLGPYTVGVKIKDFNSGVGIKPFTWSRSAVELWIQ
jgi:hypothetical protein